MIERAVRATKKDPFKPSAAVCHSDGETVLCFGAFQPRLLAPALYCGELELVGFQPRDVISGDYWKIVRFTSALHGWCRSPLQLSAYHRPKKFGKPNPIGN
jgi:hypothetical protein